ncbi:MAG: hypothetical protein ACREDR_10705, partial [Blastocatellia bacterium]
VDVLEPGVINGVHAPRFFADGLVQATGASYGGIVFSPAAQAVWTTAVIDPNCIASLSGGSTVNLSIDDNAPITGVKILNGSSVYYPKLK